MSKVPKTGSWSYFCNILRKRIATASVFYCDAKHSNIQWGSSHVRLGGCGQNGCSLLGHGTLKPAIYISRMN